MVIVHLHFAALFCPGCERPSDAQLVSPALCLAENLRRGPGPVSRRARASTTAAYSPVHSK